MKNQNKFILLATAALTLLFFLTPTILLAGTPGCCIVHNECTDMEKTWTAPDESKCASQGGKYEEKACSEIETCKKAGTKEETTPLDAPVLQSPLPGITLTSDVPIIEEQGTKYYNIPWIAEYVSGLYKFGVSVVAILAVIMIMVGGFMWLTAGGSQERVSSAKGYITGAVVGLVIATGSYTVLKIVNPALVNLKPLKISFIPFQDVEFISTENSGPSGGTGTNFPSSWAPKDPGGGTNGIPIFKQWDPQWKTISYGGCGTISSSGCGPTSMAMVLRHYGKAVDPAIVANGFAKIGGRACGAGCSNCQGTSYAAFPGLASQYGLSGKILGKTNFDEITEYLKQGKPIIVSVGPSKFTKGGHFIVLTGINGDTISVNDPNKDNTAATVEEMKKIMKAAIYVGQ